MALATPALAVLPGRVSAQRGSPGRFGRQSFIDAPGLVVPNEAKSDVAKLRLSRQWRGPLCRSRLVKTGQSPVAVKEVVLFDLVLPLPPSTRLYGEGFQMLTQSGGTLGQTLDLGKYTAAKHYKLATPDGAKAFYGMHN